MRVRWRHSLLWKGRPELRRLLLRSRALALSCIYVYLPFQGAKIVKIIQRTPNQVRTSNTACSPKNSKVRHNPIQVFRLASLLIFPPRRYFEFELTIPWSTAVLARIYINILRTFCHLRGPRSPAETPIIYSEEQVTICGAPFSPKARNLHKRQRHRKSSATSPELLSNTQMGQMGRGLIMRETNRF